MASFVESGEGVATTMTANSTAIAPPMTGTTTVSIPATKETASAEGKAKGHDEGGPYRSYEAFAIQVPPLGACKAALGAVDMTVAFRDETATSHAIMSARVGNDANASMDSGEKEKSVSQSSANLDGQSVPELAAQAEASDSHT